jgi:mRNA interferase RelE/StbE
MYKIILSKKAKQQLIKLPKEMQKRISAVIERLKIRPYHLAKRKQGTPLYRVRAGNYRLIIEIRNKELIIYVIEMGPRKNIYK